MTDLRGDIASRDDIVRLVDTFYERVRGDDVIGPVFNDVARVDWAVHLPKMYDFWDSVLFGRSGFKGDPLRVHVALARRTPMGSRQFDRWVALFSATVDELFGGPVADLAKLRASRIAVTMQQQIDAAGAGGDLH